MLNQSEHPGSTYEATARAQSTCAHTQTDSVSGVLLRVLADVALHYGVSPEALFQEDARAIMTGEPVEVRVPLSRYRALVERAISMTGEPAIGLRCALHTSDAAFDVIAPLVAHVPTLRDALRQIRQFQSLFFGGAFLHMTERTGVALLWWEFPRAYGPSDRCIAEFLTGGILRLLNAFRCGKGDLRAARFEHRRPAYHDLYTSVFRGTERFCDELTGLEFAVDLLDRPHLHSNPMLHGLIRAQVEQRLAQISRPTRLVDRLEVYLRNQPAPRVPDLSVAARDLGVSVRSLRRRLSQHGLCYRALAQELHCKHACTMLRNAEFTLQGVAAALGFSDPASFHRAFKRWTGLTAREYRARELHAPPALSKFGAY